MVLRVTGAHSLLEEGKLGLGGSVLHHVLEDRCVEGIEGPFEQVGGGATYERLLRTPGVGPHEEDEGLLYGVLIGLTLQVHQAQAAKDGLAVAF